MERLLTFILHSKALQKYAVITGAVFLLIYLTPSQYRKYAIGIFCGVGLVVAAYTLFLKGIGKKKISTFEKGLAKDIDKPQEGKISKRKAQSELAQRWKQATTELKKAGMDLYTLPWYLLIGEPQSGKSTTLRNSGLEFPVGTESLSGAGGTRNCDWWFTNEAVILDTAGRFTFQEKSAPDAGEWKSFLKMLRKTRTKCPINGVLLVIPTTSLLGDTDEEREKKATNIREKLTELQRELNVQFPVFILITKADTMLGFTEFFSRLPATDQRQILGWSMPGPFVQAYDPAKFNEVFDTVAARVHKLRLKILGEDMSLTEIDKLYVFPEEFKAIREPLHQYLKSIFVRTHYLPPLFFRGFYFTSGLQEGKPIAKACAAMLRNAGEGADELIENLAKTFQRSKAFFIRDFYTDKLFAEKSMVVHSVKKMGASRKLGIAAIVASAVLIVATVIFSVTSLTGLARGLSDIKEQGEQIKNKFIVSADRTEKELASAPENFPAKSLELAEDFSKARKKTKKIGAISSVTRDMHWMFFLQNVVREQARALRAELENEKYAGQSLKGSASAARFNQYAALWSINQAWLEFTHDGEGRFKYAEKLGWDEMDWDTLLGFGIETAAGTDEDDEDEDSPGIDRERFKNELERTIKELEQSLKFDQKVGKLYGPIALSFVPGEALPAENLVLSREVELVADSYRLGDDGTIGQIKDAGSAARAVFRSAGATFIDNVPCGYEGAGDNPFADAESGARQVLEAFNALKRLLEEKSAELASITANEADIKKRFDELAWRKKAVGKRKDDTTPRGEIEAYIDETIAQVVAERKNQAADLRKPLDEIKDLVNAQGTLRLTEDAEALLGGIAVYLALVDAQNKKITGVNAQNINSRDHIKTAVDQWLTNRRRTAALAWAAEHDEASGSWRLDDLAGAMRKMVDSGDAAVRSEAWLKYIADSTPAWPITDAIIAKASLERDPPSAANWTNLKRREASIDDLHRELSDHRSNVECNRTKDRIDDRLRDLREWKKTNRSRFRRFWQTGFEKWAPIEWVESASNWQEFRRLDAMQDKKLADRVREALVRMNNQLSNYEKDTDDSLGDLDSLYRNLDEFLRPNSTLEEICKEFTATVAALPESALDAQLMLKDTNDRFGRSYGASLDRIKNDSASLSAKFELFPEKVRALLESKEEFERRLATLLKYWKGVLGEGFPFKTDAALQRSARKTGREGNLPSSIVTIQIAQVRSADLKSFYLSTDRGPDGHVGIDWFTGKFSGFLLDDEWRGEARRNRDAALFFEACRAMRDFLLVGEEYRSIPITMTHTFSGILGDSSAELGHFSTDLSLTFPPDIFQGYRTRPRYTNPSDADRSFEWKPAEYGTENPFQFESLLDQRNERRDNVSRIIIPGDFSPLAYIHANHGGNPREDRTVWDEVKFAVEPASAEGQGKTFSTTFKFRFDRGMPEPPDWRTVESWTQ